MRTLSRVRKYGLIFTAVLIIFYMSPFFILGKWEQIKMELICTFYIGGVFLLAIEFWKLCGRLKKSFWGLPEGW